MVQQITEGIKVSVETRFEGTLAKGGVLYYAFKYTVEIENQSKDEVQLTTRYWQIKDALKNEEIVVGEGVIGQKPVLKSGNSHGYSSGCLLQSPIGSMKGYYTMVNLSNTREFKVYVPPFKLTAPFAIN